MSPRRQAALDGIVIAALTALLILPMFTAVYYDNWGAIDSTFIAHARFLIENWPHPSWQPLWYGGTRFDYIYPPALPYGTAALSMLLGIPVAQAYHLFTALLYTVGIVGVYALVRIWSKSRWMAWAAAVATALASPAFLMIQEICVDAAGRYYAPQRLNVLVQWGEGPHISSLSLIPLALAASYWALEKWSRAGVAAAALLCALVVSNNFYGSVSLVIFYTLLVWSLWLARPSKRLLMWAAGIGALAYGLTAVWLVPSYFRVTLENLASVGATTKPGDLAAGAIVAAAFLGASARLGWGRPERSYAVFVAGGAAAIGTLVLATYWFDMNILSSVGRLVPELDLAFTLLTLELARRGARRLAPGLVASKWSGPATVAAMTAVLLLAPYPRNAWRIYAQDPNPEQRIEYRMTEWIAENLPGSRLYVDGSLRFWYNVWRDLPQINGGSDQGRLNQETVTQYWNLRMSEYPESGVLWMQAFGVDAIVIHDDRSEQVYRNFDFPEKFEGVLPKIFDNAAGERIYRVPRRFPDLVRVVRKADIEALRPMEGEDLEVLATYVRAIEEGPDSRADLVWQGPSNFEITATVGPDELLLAQISHDRAWRATVDDERVPVRRDILGQTLIEVPPGRSTVRVRFRTPYENRLGGGLTILSLLAMAGLLATGVMGKSVGAAGRPPKTS